MIKKTLSIDQKNQRRRLIPTHLNIPELPIRSRKDEIVAAIRKNPVTIITGETGSGKTTQIPKFCIEAGRGVEGVIGCTQPRRIAALTVAARIAEELGTEVGGLVGYKIRFQDQTSRENSIIKVMTDGILLAEAQKDRFLNAYDTLIVDEAHERSLNIDFILGMLHRILSKRRDLKLIITSATIDTEKFSKAFHNAPVIEVSGRTFPVEVRYLEPTSDAPDGEEKTYGELAVKAAEKILSESVSGDLLIFMPTEQDIRESVELLEGRGYPGVTILPLYARLSSSDQRKVFIRGPGRKIVVATNVAETSITIPGIKYVIDTGLARISEYVPGSGATALPIKAISRSSADQRKGRCGRVENGICIRLYEEGDYESRPLYTPPEILRSNLAEVILKMIALNLGDIERFPFIDPPSLQSIRDGFNTLRELGAIFEANEGKRSGAGARPQLTPVGRIMANLPLDPRISRMLIEASRRNCLKEMTVIASALSISDPRERPPEKEKQADQKHQAFVDPYSDFLTLLNIWNKFHAFEGAGKGLGKIKKFTKENFLSFRRMREFLDVHEQISKILEEYDLSETLPRIEQAGEDKNAAYSPLYAAIHQSVLSGYLSNIALQKEKNFFQAARGREVMIFPGSGLFNRAKPWIVAAEVVKTSRLFARTAANVDSAWIEEVGKDHLSYAYDRPRWEKKRGEVVADERVSLFGLTLVSGRTVPYGPVDPIEASEIFIRSGLVEGEINLHPKDKTFAFYFHNRAMIGQVLDMENRLRKRDILVDEEDLVCFYQERLKGVTGITSLKKFLRNLKDPDSLLLTLDDLLKYRPEEEELSLFPTQIRLGGHEFECLYAFDPGSEKDGVTVKIPAAAAPLVPVTGMEWVVPGLLAEKIETLIKALPKEHRRRLVPISRHAEIIARELKETQKPLLHSLSELIHQRFGVDIPSDAWAMESVPGHLKMRISITGKDGEEICAGRNPEILTGLYSSSLKERAFDAAKKRWERSEIATWDFGDIPEKVLVEEKPIPLHAFPALTREGEAMALRLVSDKTEAETLHREGVAALLARIFSKDIKTLRKDIALPPHLEPKTKAFGGKRAFENTIVEAVVRRLFYKPFRRQAEFLKHAEESAALIYKTGQMVRERALSLLLAYDETVSSIDALLRSSRSNALIHESLLAVKADIAALLPPDVMVLYDLDRIAHLERYLRAAGIRARRAYDAPAKEALKSKETEGFKASLSRLIEGLSRKNVSQEKREAIESLFWMIEEYKVSVYAQELKTPIKVSAKILEKEIARIERLL